MLLEYSLKLQQEAADELVCRNRDQHHGFEEVLLCIAVHPGSSTASLRLNRVSLVLEDPRTLLQ